MVLVMQLDNPVSSKVSMRFGVYLIVLLLVAVAAFAYFSGKNNASPVHFDKPTFADFAESVEYGDLAFIGTVMDPGEVVIDHGLGVEAHTSSVPAGMPVVVAEVLVDTVLVDSAVEELGVKKGDVLPLIIDQTVYTGGASAEKKMLAPNDRLLLSVEYLPAGSSAVTTGDAFTPVGLDNGVVAIHGNELDPWEPGVTAVAGTPLHEVQLSDIVPALAD